MGEREKIVEERLGGIFLQKTRDEWFDILKNIDVCVGRVLAIDEMREDPQEHKQSAGFGFLKGPGRDK